MGPACNPQELLPAGAHAISGVCVRACSYNSTVLTVRRCEPGVGSSSLWSRFRHNQLSKDSFAFSGPQFPSAVPQGCKPSASFLKAGGDRSCFAPLMSWIDLEQEAQKQTLCIHWTSDAFTFCRTLNYAGLGWERRAIR